MSFALSSHNFLIAALDLAYAIIHCRIPTNLLPESLCALFLDECERPTHSNRLYTQTHTHRTRWGLMESTEWTSSYSEGNRGVLDSVVEDSSFPVSMIVNLVIDEQWLLIASEVSP